MLLTFVHSYFIFITLHKTQHLWLQHVSFINQQYAPQVTHYSTMTAAGLTLVLDQGWWHPVLMSSVALTIGAIMTIYMSY